MYEHMEYSQEDINMLEKIATTKLAIPERRQGMNSDGKKIETTQSRVVSNAKIISSKTRANAPAPTVAMTQVSVDPIKQKIANSCSNIPIFNGVNSKDLFSFMLQPKIEIFKDGDEILKANSSTKKIYIPITGEVCIIDESHGMYSLNGFVECFGIFNLAETVTYRKNKYTYIASGSGAIEVLTFSINEGMINSSPRLFATVYQNISRLLSNVSLDK